MAIKYMQVIVDDFSERAEYFPNTEVYDFGLYSQKNLIDNYYLDYRISPYPKVVDAGDVDYVDEISSFFDYVNPSVFFDSNVINSGTIGPELLDYSPYFDLYMYEGYMDYLTVEEFTPYSSSGSGVQHGDWVLDAFFNQIDNPNNVEVLAIDFDFTTG